VRENMSTVLIGVMSCIHDAQNGNHDAIRRTWVRHMVPGLEYRIFVGQGAINLAPDEVQLDVPDDYPHLPEKAQAMRMWALEHGYDYMFKADRDTFLSPRRLLASGFEQHDYAGYFPYIPEGSKVSHLLTPSGYVPTYPDCRGAHIYASGAPGYWLSKRAMELMVAAPLDEKREDNRGNPAEDLWIPNVLFPAGVRGYHDTRYLFMGNRLVGDAITVHLGINGYHSDYLYNCYNLSVSAL